MNKKFTLLLFSIAVLLSSTFAQSQRMILAEAFTSTTCGPCAMQNPAFDALLGQNLDKVVSIKYHMSWPSPGNDPFYLDNPSENNNRRSYYGISSVPQVQLEGGAWAGSPSNVTQSRIDAAAAITSPFEMQMQAVISPTNDTIHVTTLIKATNDITNNLTAHTAIIEKYLHYDNPPGNNGEKDFHNVMKKMLPTASGTTIEAPMTAGDYVILQSSWALDYIYDIDQLAAVGFIQNTASKDVYQAALSSEDAITPVYSLDAEVLSVANVTTTNCFGNLSPKATIRNNGQTQLTSLTIEYSVNGGDVQSKEWTGSLGFLETAVVELDEIQFEVLESNNLEIVGLTPNASTDDYEKNNTLVYTFEQAPTLSGGVNLFMIFDNSPEETTWELFNSTGTVIQSGGPYDTPGAMEIVPLEVSTMDCYELIVYDAGGNGMCCTNGDGYYAVIYGNNLTAFQGNSFGELDRNQFSFDPVGINETALLNEVNIFPNPVSDNLNISFNLTETSDVSILVYDLLGKVVFESNEGVNKSGNKELNISLGDLNSGFYLLKLKAGNKTFAKKISVK
jgi:hypothetical protein